MDAGLAGAVCAHAPVGLTLTTEIAAAQRQPAFFTTERAEIAETNPFFTAELAETTGRVSPQRSQRAQRQPAFFTAERAEIAETTGGSHHRDRRGHRDGRRLSPQRSQRP